MAASIGRAKIVTKRTNLVQYLLNRNVPATIICGSSHTKGSSLILHATENHSLPTATVSSFHPTFNIRFQSSSQAIEFVCWNCNNIHSSYVFICEKCKSLQEIQDGMTYFEVLGIPNSFVVDATSLTKKFRELQSRFHPDKFTNKSQVRLENHRCQQLPDIGSIQKVHAKTSVVNIITHN